MMSTKCMPDVAVAHVPGGKGPACIPHESFFAVRSRAPYHDRFLAEWLAAMSERCRGEWPDDVANVEVPEYLDFTRRPSIDCPMLFF